MIKPVYEFCGIDVHKKDLVVRVITRNPECNAKWTVKNTGEGIRVLIKQLHRYSVKKVGFESTGSYWELLYDLLEPHFDLTLANARQTRALPGDPKTDERDALWIATLLAKGMLRKSYVPPREQRQLRGFCRLQASLKKELTRYLNKQHVILDRWDVNFSKHFSSISTKVCQYLMKELAEGKTFAEAVSKALDRRTANKIRSKRGELEQYFEREFPALAGVELLALCSVVETHQREIKRIEKTIDQLASQLDLDEKIALVTAIKGVGRPSAIALLAETGDMDKFADGRKLVAWCGLNPSVYQSAGTNYTGRITKCGNKHVRRILHNCALVNLREKENELYEFYQRVHQRKGSSKALVALMAKMLRVMHAVLTKGEPYEQYPRIRQKKSGAAVS